MHTVTSRDGTGIAFDRFGKGPPVILLGGALQHRAFDPSTAELAAILVERFSVFNYDRRGRGDSADTPPYAVEREFEDLDALIEEAGGSAFIYGSSSGGNLALAAALRGGLIEKIALWEPNFLVDDSRPPLPQDYVAELEERVAVGRRGDAVEYFLTAAVRLPGKMSELRVFMSISLGGFVAGSNLSAEDPLGVGRFRLHEWILPSAAWREGHTGARCAAPAGFGEHALLDKDCMNVEVKACLY